MIATGSYRAIGVSASLEKSPDKGTEGVRVTIRLEEGSDKGAQIDWVGWLTDKTLARTAESLALMGYDGENLETVRSKAFVVVIEHEAFTRNNGESATRARVAWINDPTGGGRMDPMNVAEVAGAKARLKAAMALAKQKSAKPLDPADEPRF